MIEFLKTLARDAGRLCLEASRRRITVEFKSAKDLVTEVDKQVEAFITSSVQRAYPGHDVFGEETGRSHLGSDFCWIIDPIDGTTSFFHKQPFYSVSIAVQNQGKTIAGAVYAPVLDELFWAEKGGGAHLNTISVRVSEAQVLADSVLATGFACLRAGLRDNNLKYFNELLPRIRDIRRYGSAALDLCFVACGRLDGFWEMNLNLYDVAAGALIVTEAGGRVCDFQGGASFPGQGIVATNGGIETELLSYLDPSRLR
ncbi:MAG: inositol monophosphatase family protein [Pseudomonadota bacterium]